MKTTNRTASAIVALGLTGLVAATGSGCASSEAPFRTYINSSRAQREVLHEQNPAKKALKTGRFEEGHVLYVPMQSAAEVLKSEFGLDIDKMGYRSLFEGNLVDISYRDQDGEIVSQTQKIANNCTIDTLDFGSFDACVPRTTLDAAITEVAKSKGIDSVSVTEVDHPMQEEWEFFTGKAWYLGEINGQLVSGGVLAPAALKAHRIMLETGIGHDAKYVSVVMSVPETNGFDRVVAVADAYDVMSGKVDMTVPHDGTIIASGTNHYKDIRSFAREIGGGVNDITGVSDAIQQLHYSADKGFRRNYLDGRNGHRESGLQRAGRVVGEAGILKLGVKSLAE